MRRSTLVFGATLLLAGCGGGMPAQDENEPEGEFEVSVTRASFPESQSLAKQSRLVIELRNVGDETVPDANVTVHGFERKQDSAVDPEQVDPGLADPERPVFVVEKSPVEFLREPIAANPSLVNREVAPDYGRKTAYVDTYSLGELPPGEAAEFRWEVSAVEPGPFELRYEVHAGLDGNAVAVDGGGEPLTGSFSGVIESDPPPARVAGDGETIVQERARPSGQGGRGVILGD